MIWNLTKKTLIAEKPRAALSFWERARGMIGRRFDDSFDAMIFANCNSIHTFLMSIPLDVIFIDFNHTVVGLRKNLAPWCPGVIVRGSYTVIELPPGIIDRSGTVGGDTLDLSAVPSGNMLKMIMKHQPLVNEPGTLLPYGEEKK